MSGESKSGGRAMRLRPGVTLIEVLAAIFIMGIGMLAILVLFPLGALSIAKALRDDRCAAIAPNAHALAVAFKLGNDQLDTNPTAPANLVTNTGSKLYVPFTWDPLQKGYPPQDSELPTPDPADQADPSHPNWPSYSVFVDPYYHTRLTGPAAANPASWLVTTPRRTVARVMPNYVRNYPINTTPAPNATTITRDDVFEYFFSLRDDLAFRPNGYPQTQRQGLFTWGYMLRRLHAGSPNSLEMQVIVYSGRPIEVPVAEPTYALATTPTVAAAAAPGDTSFTLTWGAGQERPDLKRGAWLYDSSYQRKVNTAVPPVPRAWGYTNGCFYRVMDVIDVGANLLQIEVQPPLKVVQPGDTITQMTTLPGAVEVFERGNLRP